METAATDGNLCKFFMK